MGALQTELPSLAQSMSKREVTLKLTNSSPT